MHTGVPVTSGDDSGIIGGSPRNDPRMDDDLNLLGPYSWYRVRTSADVSTHGRMTSIFIRGRFSLCVN